MLRVLLAAFCTVTVVTAASADYADYLYIAPAPSAKAEGPVPGALLAALLEAPRPLYVLDRFAGLNAALKAASTNPALQVAVHEPVDVPGATLFAEPQPGLGGWVYTADLISAGAYALRLEVDLSGLPAGAEVYAVDLSGPRAFGPFTAEDGTRWLPTLAGEAGALLAVMPEKLTPGLQVVTMAHFYEDLAKKALPCPAAAACGTDPMFQEVSTGVARLLIPLRGVGALLCTGTLLNNPDTTAREPLMVTAHHCFDGDVIVSGIEVYWDYRAANCDGTNVPTLPSLPRSAGSRLIASNACLDAEFIEVQAIASGEDDVPNGAYGRAWVGWDTRRLALNHAVTAAHHPGGTPMKMCVGRVTALDTTTCLAGFGGTCTEEVYRQTEVHWDEGITEGGSSGSALLLNDYNYRVVGVLSNGPVHDCANPSQNLDNFASFSEFYPQIQCYLRSGLVCEEGYPCGDTENGLCPFKAVFGNDSIVTGTFRALRDEVLRKSQWTRPLVDNYYKAAPAMTCVVEACPLARVLFTAGAARGVLWVRGLGLVD